MSKLCWLKSAIHLVGKTRQEGREKNKTSAQECVVRMEVTLFWRRERDVRVNYQVVFRSGDKTGVVLTVFGQKVNKRRTHSRSCYQPLGFTVWSLKAPLELPTGQTIGYAQPSNQRPGPLAWGRSRVDASAARRVIAGGFFLCMEVNLELRTTTLRRQNCYSYVIVVSFMHINQARDFTIWSSIHIFLPWALF